jgi:cell division protein FtsQ
MNTMDHRIAERRHEVTEERARGRLRWLIWLVVLVGAIAAGIWFVNSPILSIRAVTVTGAVQTDPAAIADGLSVRAGTPTISVRAGEIESALLASPWIAEADVTVSWPGSVEIDVRERVPVSSVTTDLGRFNAAVDGVVVERVDASTEPPTVVSDRTGALREGDRIAHAGTLGALEFIAALPPALRETTIVTIDGDSATATVAEYTIVLGRPTEMAFKAAALEALIATGLESGSRIDVRAPNRPAVAPPQSQLEGEAETLQQSQPTD